MKNKQVQLFDVLAVVARIRSYYPIDIFPDKGESQDCKSAQMARITCDNIKKELIAEFGAGA